jgi:hypothetical protein
VADKAQIFNRALYKLNKARITNPAQSVELSDIYDTCRQAVLRAHPWNCALVRTSLSADETTTDWKYAYAYTLPSNPYCLRVVKLEDTKEKWEVVKGRKLVTDAGAPLRIEYIADITDESEFDAEFVEAFAVYLAHEAGPKLGATSGRLKDLWKEWEAKVGTSRSVDGQEGYHLEVEADDYTDSRA